MRNVATLTRENEELKAKLRDLEVARPFAAPPADQATEKPADEAPPANPPEAPPEAPPAGAPPPGTTTPTSSSRLGEDGARKLVRLLLHGADGICLFVASRLLIVKVGVERTRELAGELQKATTLQPQEKDALEALLVSRFAVIEVDPDTLLVMVGLGILLRMTGSVLQVAQTGRAPAPGEPSTFEQQVSETMSGKSWPKAERVDTPAAA